jgi:hypothetical protein
MLPDTLLVNAATTNATSGTQAFKPGCIWRAQ